MIHTQEDVKRAIEIGQDHCIINRGALMTYTAMYGQLGWPPPDVIHEQDPGFSHRFMEDVFNYIQTHRGEVPPVDALIVRQEDLWPGDGYFKGWGHVDPRKSTSEAKTMRALAHWASQVEECRLWGKAHRKVRVK